MPSSDLRPYASRLAIRFAIILALALLPAGIISIIQTNALDKEIQARSEAALLGATLQAAAAETDVIARVRGTVSTLARAVPFVSADTEACSDLMTTAAEEEPLVAVAAFVPISGLMTCSSVGRTHDFTGDPMFEKLVSFKEPHFLVNPSGPLSGVSILGISHPVFDFDGMYVGYVGMSLPHEAIDELRLSSFVTSQSLIDVPVVFWTFDRQGAVLTANVGLETAQQYLPRERSLSGFVGTEAAIFGAASTTGRAMTYSVVPIVQDELYLMSSFPPEELGLLDNWTLSAYLPTLVMWLIGLIVSGFAAEMLVARHVRTLNRAINSFARGDRRLQVIDLSRAPVELDELASAYSTMTESIIRSEAELEDSVHQKEVLLREVHHRVKNNLQLISSIMNIQIRSANSGEAKELLKNLQERIMSLATVHRGLYQTSGLADVRARELIPDIVRQIMSISSGPEKPFDTQTDIDDLRLVPDQAVPLALLLAEALTNAIKHAGVSRNRPGKLTVRLKRSGGSDAVLGVCNSHYQTSPAFPETTPSGSRIGSQLIMAFVQQLGGTLQTGLDGDEYSLKVTFPVSPLSQAEARQAPVVESEAEWNASDA